MKANKILLSFIFLLLALCVENSCLLCLSNISVWIIITALPFSTLAIAILFDQNKKPKKFIQGCLVAVFNYLVIIFGVELFNIFLLLILKKQDINNDGFFSIIEQTKTQKRIMDLYINDVGRKLFYFTGFFLSILSSFCYLIVNYLHSRYRREHTKSL